MPAASLEYHRNYYAKRCAEFVEYLGGVCVECGTTESLEFDHVDPATKLFTITARAKARWEIMQPELDKCQLLCREHHKAKSRLSQSVEHGGGKSGKRNCKCAPCKRKKAEYMATCHTRAMRAERKAAA